jgi:chemotaxis signal transduction protein
MSEIVGAVTEEVGTRVENVGEAIKLTGSAIASTPGEVAGIAADFLTGGGELADATFDNITDAVVAKIKQGLAVLDALAGVRKG